MTTSVFVESNSFLHRADERSKIFCALASVVFQFLPLKNTAFICFGFLIIAFPICCGLWKKVWKTFLSILPMLVLIFMLFHFYEGGLEEVSFIALRLFNITFTFACLLWTTRDSKIITALRWYGLSYKASLTISLILRFIPSISDTFNRISESHRIRKTKGGKFSSVIPTLTSALVCSLREIPVLAMTLEMRGYGLKNKRSSFNKCTNIGQMLIQTTLWLAVCATLVIIFNR